MLTNDKGIIVTLDRKQYENNWDVTKGEIQTIDTLPNPPEVLTLVLTKDHAIFWEQDIRFRGTIFELETSTVFDKFIDLTPESKIAFTYRFKWIHKHYPTRYKRLIKGHLTLFTDSNDNLGQFYYTMYNDDDKLLWWSIYGGVSYYKTDSLYAEYGELKPFGPVFSEIIKRRLHKARIILS